MNKKQILNISIAVSIIIAFFVVGTVVITSAGGEKTAYAEAAIEKSVAL